MLKLPKWTSVWAWLVIASATPAMAQGNKPEPAAANGRIVGRIIWQDNQARTLRWGDARKGSSWSLTAAQVANFPKLQEQANFVQMEEIDGLVLTGVHDDQDGSIQSGWVAVDAGVIQEEHGDHFHWKYPRAPQATLQVLDAEQGNPAHIYQYSGRFYLANDKKNGFSVVDPKLVKAGKVSNQFFSGGGGHITLAAVDNQVAYATWIDRDGDNLGRVDVVSLVDAGRTRRQFHLPSGGIHGATANSGRVFFAPTDGVCWIDATSASATSQTAIKVHHLPLGQDAKEQPLRTGAFTNHLQWVVFTTGRGEAAELCLIDARAAKPTVVKLPLALPAGASVTSPRTVRTSKGKHYAMLFQECSDGSAPEKLLAISLDANSDGQLGDAAIEHQLEIGASRIEGHTGHHEIAFAANGRYAYITNPGDGSIWIIDTTDMSVASQQTVGGMPTRIAVIGG